MKNLTEIKNFSTTNLYEIYNSEETIPEGKLFKKDLKNCKVYILETIFPLLDGDNICYFADNKLEITSLATFNTMILNRFPCKELKEWFKTSPEIIYFKLHSAKSDVVSDYEKKILYNCPTIKAAYKPYDGFDVKTKKQCEMMMNHIKNINCGGDNTQYEYLLKIIKRMCLAEKNNVAVLIKSYEQGSGKSTFLKFLEQYVIGEHSTCVGTSKMVTSGFNYPMFNKILIKFEELPCFTREQFKGISGNFKTWITEDFINYEDKGKSSFNSYNCHTMVVISNDDCIDDDNGRRWYILDQSTNYFIDTEAKMKYFNKLYSECFNQDVGNCFYSYLIENVIIPKNWDASSNMPLTKNKKVSLSQKLAKPFVFLKENYLLKEKDINMKMKDLHKEYIDTNLYYKMNVETFNKHITESVLKSYIIESGGYKKLKIKHTDLKIIYEKNNWISDFDEYEKDELQKETDEHNETEIKTLKQEIERLNKMIEDMKKTPIVEQKNKPVVTKVVEPVQPKKIVFIDDDLEADLKELEQKQEQKPFIRQVSKNTCELVFRGKREQVVIDSEDEEENDDVSSLF
jgi:hypothetical protein